MNPGDLVKATSTSLLAGPGGKIVGRMQAGEVFLVIDSWSNLNRTVIIHPTCGVLITRSTCLEVISETG